METSDDFISNIFGGGDDTPDLPSQKAENVRRTATALPQGSEAAKQKRLQASLITRPFAEAKLGQPGLLGLPPSR